MAVRLRLVHPVPTRIAPGTSPPCTGEVPLARRTPRAQPDERSPSHTRLAVSPLLPHQANAISSPPAALRLRRSVIRGLNRAAEPCGAPPGREHALFGLAFQALGPAQRVPARA